jgi:hypothetical protein
MKIRYAFLLIFGAAFAVGAEEVKWLEKEIFTVSEVEGAENSVVKIKVATPELTGYAGFFSKPGTNASVAVGIKTAGVTPGRIDAWENVEITVPQKYLDAALDPKDPWGQSLMLTADPTHRSQKPLSQWGHSFYIVMKQEKADKIAVHPEKDWTGFRVSSCGVETKTNQLPIVYSRVTDPARNLGATYCGLLNIESGRISEVVKDEGAFGANEQLNWISDQLVAITSSSRYGEHGAVVDLTKKEVTASQYIPGAARWLITGGHLHAWHLSPGAIPINPGD